MRKIFLFSAILFILVTPNFSSGQGLVPCGNDPNTPCTLCDFFVMFKNIIDFLLKPPTGLIPILAVLMIVIGGFMYVISYASPDAGPGLVSKAKALFGAVAIGLLIAYGAWVIVNLFFTIFVKENWQGTGSKWYNVQLDCGGAGTTLPITH